MPFNLIKIGNRKTIPTETRYSMQIGSNRSDMDEALNNWNVTFPNFDSNFSKNFYQISVRRKKSRAIQDETKSFGGQCHCGVAFRKEKYHVKVCFKREVI